MIQYLEMRIAMQADGSSYQQSYSQKQYFPSLRVVGVHLLIKVTLRVAPNTSPGNMRDFITCQYYS